MFEDKRFNKNHDNDNNTINDDYGINLGNDNLKFASYSYVPEPEPLNNKHKKEPNYKWVRYLFFAFICLIFIIILFIILLKILGSPVKIYENSVNYGYSYLKNYIEELDNKKLEYYPNEDSVELYGDIKINTNNKNLKDINEFTLDYDLGLDIKNERIQGLLNLKENNKSILDLNLYVINNILLFKSDKLYDNLINVGAMESLDFNSLKTNYSNDDILDIITFLNKYFNENLDNDKITKEKDNIKIKGKNYRVSSNIYYLSSSDVKQEFINIINDILNDDTTLRAFSNLLNKTRKEVKEYLEEIKNKEEYLDDFKELKIKIYTKGLNNKVLGFHILYDNIDIFKLSYVDNILNVDIFYKDSNININKNNNNINICIYKNKEKILKAFINLQNDITNIELYINDKKINIVYELKRIGNKRQTLNLNVELLNNEQDNNKYIIDIHNTTQIGNKIANINLDNVVKLEDLTEDELSKISNNLTKVLDDTFFENLFLTINSKIINSSLCSIATDCQCENEICTCKYRNEDNVEHSIICNY